MARGAQDEIIFAAGAQILHRADARCVYTLSGSDGRVQITQYAVFPGIWLLYRDVHAGIHIPVAASTAGLLEICLLYTSIMDDREYLPLSWLSQLA